ncbi:hypothetical protein LJB42_004067 [Komagataella kurtzmanii]|nr:hypothetical protein LJB42_004067 [Komagataella kurtzmanii]
MIEKIHRIYIGNISADLASDIGNLETRLKRYGTLEKPLELHKMPLLDSYFAYISLKLSDQDFAKLKGSLNGLNYKGSRVVVDMARPDFHQKWLEDSKRPDLYKDDRLKRAKVAQVRLERIRQKNVVTHPLKGRMRTCERKDKRRLTFRVKINGKLKTVQCRKQKLWGYDKKREARDLVYTFSGTEWRDGFDHVVDRPSRKRKHSEANLEDQDVEIETIEEEKNMSILDSFLRGYDFEKPVNREDDSNSNDTTTFDFETGQVDAEAPLLKIGKHNSVVNVDTMKVPEVSGKVVIFDENGEVKELEDVIEIDQTKGSVGASNHTASEHNSKYSSSNDENSDSSDGVNRVNNSKTSRREGDSKGSSRSSDSSENSSNDSSDDNSDDSSDQSSDDSSDDDSDDSDDGQLTNYASSRNTATKGSRQLKDSKGSKDLDTEFLPNFTKGTPSSSKTEALRELLNPANSSFKLFGVDDSNDDIDMNKEIEPSVEERIAIEQQFKDKVEQSSKKTRNLGLFFTHDDSPFLAAQSQVNKHPGFNAASKDKFLDWFQAKRGDLNRAFRARKREAKRALNKYKADDALL